MSSASLTTAPSKTPRWPKVKSVLLKITRIPARWLCPVSKFKLHIIASIIITIVALVLSVVMTKLFVIRNLDFFLETIYGPGDEAPRMIFLTPDFIAVDAAARTSSIDWLVADLCTEPLPNNTVNIYFDPNLLLKPGGSGDESGDKAVPSVDLASTPVFSYNSATSCNDTLASIPSFRTDNKLMASILNLNKTKKSSLQYYPFDRYLLPISIFARDNATNSTVTIAITETLTGLSNFNFKLNKTFSAISTDFSQYVVEVYRSRAVQVLVIVIVAANWLVTVAFMSITLASVMWPEHVVKEFFVIPIASLFAFTAVRSNMPGAPSGFGAIVDYFGILPNLAIMTLCSAILLGVVLFRRTRAYSDGAQARSGRTNETGQGLIQALGAAEKAVATANEALAVVRGSFVTSNPPPTINIQGYATTNKTPTDAEGVLTYV